MNEYKITGEEIVNLECQRIADEMLADLLIRTVNSLEKIDKFIIRHSWGLPRNYDKSWFYRKLPRKEISAQLGISAREVYERRISSQKQILKEIFNPH